VLLKAGRYGAQVAPALTPGGVALHVTLVPASQSAGGNDYDKEICMKTFSTMALTGALAGSMLLLTGAAGSAQEKTLQGESVTVKAEIVAIEPGTRTITVKNDKGIYETLQAGPEVKRFSELKVGDKITARYFDNVVVRLKKPGEAAVDVDTAQLNRNEKAPGLTAQTERTITVTVTAMDPKTSTVTVNGPNGYVYSRKVADKKAFNQLKVGDKLDMTWVQALLVFVEPAK
jgi:hypothetical protein